MNLVSECTTMSAPNLRQRTQTTGWCDCAGGLVAGPAQRGSVHAPLAMGQAAARAGQQGQGSRATPSHRRGDSTKGVNVLSTTSLRLCGQSTSCMRTCGKVSSEAHHVGLRPASAAL